MAAPGVLSRVAATAASNVRCGAGRLRVSSAISVAAGGGPVAPSRRSITDLSAERAAYPIEKRIQEHEPQSTTDGPDTLAPADSKITWKRGDAVQLRMADSGRAAIRPISVMTLMRETTERGPNRLALAAKVNDVWNNHTYEEYYSMSRQAARSFIELGLEPESAVGILGFNSTEWVLSSMGAIFAGGYSAGIYTTNSPDACHYVADNARCNVIVVEDDKQLQKILSIRSRLPHLKAIIQYRGQPDKELEGVYSWSEFMSIGSQSLERELESRIKVQAPNKCCTIIYTSGTSGDPKGVMLSHDNLVWTSGRVSDQLGHSFANAKRCLSYLPLSHVAAQVADIYAPIHDGSACYFAQPDALKGSLGQSIKEVRPHVLLGVPRVWEKMQDAITTAAKQSSPVKRRILGWARAAGTKGNLARMSGQEPPLTAKIADRLVLSKIRQAIGLDETHLCISSAAPISRSTLDFFVSLNVPIAEVYGMSELSGPHTCGIATNNVVGSVGPELPGTKTVAKDPDSQGVGEMLVDGRNVCMGYLNLKDKTLETFGGPDGTYLLTGDLVRRDERGLLHVPGRIKEILITAGGENVPSVQIENAFKDCLPILSNCMLIGDGRRYLTMLITIKTNVDMTTMTPLNTLSPDVVSWCRQLNSEALTVRDVINDAAVSDAIQTAIDVVNRNATSNAQKIQKWRILPVDFSIANGELGPTLKLRRHFVLQKYSNLIESMYSEQPTSVVVDTHDVTMEGVVTSPVLSSPYNV